MKLKFIFQGDSALFGINGFNLLVDGGFSRKGCFWDFSRHLDRLDAVLITRISDDNAGGMSALLKRKTLSGTYPQIGKYYLIMPQWARKFKKGQAKKTREIKEINFTKFFLIKFHFLQFQK